MNSHIDINDVIELVVAWKTEKRKTYRPDVEREAARRFGVCTKTVARRIRDSIKRRYLAIAADGSLHRIPSVPLPPRREPPRAKPVPPPTDPAERLRYRAMRSGKLAVWLALHYPTMVRKLKTAAALHVVYARDGRLVAETVPSEDLEAALLTIREEDAVRYLLAKAGIATPGTSPHTPPDDDDPDAGLGDGYPDDE